MNQPDLIRNSPPDALEFGSVCSGIEAASVAFAPLGWKPAWLAEIEPFPSAVLAHHYPDVPNVGDMTAIVRRVLSGELEAPDLFCGGTPCQAFSVAGKRQSLDDARGNLSLTFCEIADAIDHVRAARGADPCVVLWENVPGVLSTRDNAFGCFLGALAGADCELQPPGERWTDAGCVYGPARAVAWRVLDAQYFGLAQRRRRVFVVASARNGFDPAAVLFESDGVRRDTPPRREAGQDTAGSTGDGVARCLTTGEAKRQDWETCTMVAHSLRGEGFDASASLTCSQRAAVAYDVLGVPATVGAKETDLHTCLRGRPPGQSEASTTTVVQQAMSVRRLTPRECEALQGFEADYTRIPWRGKPAEFCPDGPRYKALGNSWAVPCVAWIGRRIARALA